MKAAKSADIDTLEELFIHCYDVRTAKDKNSKSLKEMAESNDLPKKVCKFLLKTIPILTVRLSYTAFGSYIFSIARLSYPVFLTDN